LGANSGKNVFFKSFTEKFIFGHEQELFRQNAKRNSAQFLVYCDSLLREKLNFLSAYDGSMYSSFVLRFKNDFVYENACNKLSYPGLWSYLNRKGDTLSDMSVTYFDFLKHCR